MKNILIILIFCSHNILAQTGVVNGWNYTVTLPDGYVTTSIRYPTIIFIPGTSEVGTNANLLRVHGPHAYIDQGGNIPGFIVISLQPQTMWPVESAIHNRIQLLTTLFRMDTLRINGTGLSMGGWCFSTFVSGGYPYLKSVITVQGVKPEDNTPYPSVFGNWIGKHLAFEQRMDGRGGLELVNYLNSLHPGQAQFIETNYGNGGHCCYNNFYGGQGVQPAKFLIAGQMQNIYEYLTKINALTTTNIFPTVRGTRNRIENLPQDNNTVYFKAGQYDKYCITNRLGQMVLTGNYRAGLNQISIKDLKPGVYILKTQFENYKIIKY